VAGEDGEVRLWVPYDDAVERMGGVPDGVEVDVYDGSGAPPSSIGEVEFYVVPYMSPDDTPLRLMRDMPSLRVAQTLTAGVDNYLRYLPEGVTLCNARGVHDASTAELAVALTLAALRGLPDFVRAQARDSWEPARHRSLADRTVLIVGYGSVGAAIERRLDGFESRVLRVARTAREGVSPMEDLCDLLPQADVVVLVVPMTDQTRGLADAGFLASMPDGALLVNVSRGPVVVTDALVAELASGRLLAALDVTDPEPLPAGHPLWSVPGLLLSPHVGGNTTAFLPRAFRLLADQLRRYQAGQPLANVITGDY
jgi:phosphoglycerate dehydrogenase-like enzyme